MIPVAFVPYRYTSVSKPAHEKTVKDCGATPRSLLNLGIVPEMLTFQVLLSKKWKGCASVPGLQTCRMDRVHPDGSESHSKARSEMACMQLNTDSDSHLNPSELQSFPGWSGFPLSPSAALMQLGSYFVPVGISSL
ncbi:hypothetical protein AVEN_166362-1 [Araneus ventricosus]|uniref:Uncharacterized protein n=1 Tax=Araneus ventricosus TaxID=182803 RepID=A0A4Y2SXH8_ARAVE|nr:hypothetical protein AVEN_166362-1 [Araneus ventricosus]